MPTEKILGSFLESFVLIFQMYILQESCLIGKNIFVLFYFILLFTKNAV